MGAQRTHRPWHLGLTGGIGSGKSTVAAMLGQRGAEIVDADALARQCTGVGGAAIDAIRSHFGSDYIAADGSMNRDRMRNRAFSDPSARRLLESLVHPHVVEAIHRAAAVSCAPMLVFDIPLLVESARWRHRFDQIWVVDCQHHTQVERVMQRNGWTAAQVETVISHQSPRQRRLDAADGVLFNEGLALDDLQALVSDMAKDFGL